MQEHRGELISFMIANMDWYSYLIQPLKDHMGRLNAEVDPIFSDEIEKQYKDRVKWILVADICKRTSINVEEVLMFLENVNMETF